MHDAALPIRRCQLENWARFSPQPPFSWALIISDKICGFESLSSFTFKIYLGPSSSFPPIFMCFNYFRQSSNTLCECLEDQLNVAFKKQTPNIFDDLAGEKIFENICTMKGCTVKNVIFYFFTRHDVIAPHTKFHVSQTPPSCFLLIYDPFLTNIWRKYFSCNHFRVLHQQKL